MKLSKILMLIMLLCVVFSGVSFAKSLKGMDETNSSVQLLKQLNNDGIEKRKQDNPIQKPDISSDITRAQGEKDKFYEQKRIAFPSLYGIKDIQEEQ